MKTWLPLFSYQAILSSIQDAESTSVSPSPSTSAAKTDSTESAVVEMIRLVKPGCRRSRTRRSCRHGRRGEHVDVPVPVHVRRKDRDCTIGGGGDDPFGEDLAAVVLVPGDLVVSL